MERPRLNRDEVACSALAALTVLAASWTLGRATGYSKIVAPACVAVALGGVLAWLCAERLRRTSVVVAFTALVAIAGGVGVGLIFAMDDNSSWAASLRGVLTGWKAILTTALPVPLSHTILGAIGALLTAASALAVISVNRRRLVTALLPALVVTVAGIGVSIDGPGSLTQLVAPVLLAIALYLFIALPLGERVHGSWSRRALYVAALAVVTLLLGTHLPFANALAPVDPRDRIDQQRNLGEVNSPLDLLPSLDREAVVFTATVDDAWKQHPANWRLAGLDAFDGNSWSVSADYLTAGTEVRPALLPEGPSSRQTVVVDTNQWPWVPTTGVVTGIEPAGLAVDPVGGTVVDPGRSGRATYQLRSVLPAVDSAALSDAPLATVGGTAAATAVPSCLPAAVQTMGAEVGAQPLAPGGKAFAVQRLLSAQSFTLDNNASGGRSCAALDTFFSAKVGTNEQFAAAFVLLARMAGLPSRLTVGFGPGAVDESGRIVVRGSDATVWPEVDLAGVGWVGFNPLPQQEGTTPSTSALAPQPQQPESPNSTIETGPPVTTPVGLAPHSNGASTTVRVAAVLTVLLLLLGTLLFWRLRPQLHRLVRRHRGTPQVRLVNAWVDTVDHLERRGIASRSMTAVDVRRHMSDPDAGNAVQRLGELVDSTVYGGAPVTSAEVSKAWRHAAVVRARTRQLSKH